MRIAYYPESDTPYVDLWGRTGAKAGEAAPDTVLDLDSVGVPVGIEREHAGEKLDLSRLDAQSHPLSDAPLGASVLGRMGSARK